jgi:hypothetical protein
MHMLPMPNIPRAVLVIAPSLATAAAFVTDVRWLDHVRAPWPTVPVALVLFWSAALATVATVFLVRRYTKWCVLSLAASAIALCLAGPMALAWTAWSVSGFTP